MANYIEETNIPASRFAITTSRYYDSEVLYYTEKKLLTYKTYKRKEVPSNVNDKFMIISKGYEYRPDLVAYRAYRIPELWWKILEANNMKDIMEFKAGVNIRIPNIIT